MERIELKHHKGKIACIISPVILFGQGERVGVDVIR